jgi:hypothetical protein
MELEYLKIVPVGSSLASDKFSMASVSIHDADWENWNVSIR